MNLRDYHPSDLPYLYDICLRTGAAGKDASALYADPYLLGQYWAAPYAVRDPRLVLILENEARRPIGYVLGTDDTEAFDRWMAAEWLPALRRLYPAIAGGVSDAEAWMRGLIAAAPRAERRREWLPDYPGHLHIDILPEGQGRGWGARLIDAFRARLASVGCAGVHLGVARANENAVAFYRKYGFAELGSDEGTLFMGIAG
jgi:GNAT superfamily N-acetyltransferase